MEQPTPHKSKNPKRKDGKKNLSPNKARYNTAKEMVVKLTNMGFDSKDIRERLIEEFGYTPLSAKDVVEKTGRELQAKYESYKDKIGEINIKRLMQLIEDCYEQGKVKDVNTCIDTLNKMTKQYTQQIKVEGNGDFQIKLDK